MSIAGLITGDGLSTLPDLRAGVAFAEGMVRDWEVRGRLLAELAALADDAWFDGTSAVFLLEALTGSLPQARQYDEDDEEGVPDDPLVDPTHPQFLAALGMPVHAHAEPDEWDGGTAGMVRTGTERMARSGGPRTHSFPALRLMPRHG